MVIIIHRHSLEGKSIFDIGQKNLIEIKLLFCELMKRDKSQTCMMQTEHTLRICLPHYEPISPQFYVHFYP